METHSGDHLTTARNILRDARLEHPNTLLIEVFLDYAVDPQKASEYLVRRCAHNFDCTELGKFLEDWKALVEMFMTSRSSPKLDRETRNNIAKRDGYQCCFTGEQSRFWKPLHIVPILPITRLTFHEGPLFDILGAFISPHQRDLLLSWSKLDVKEMYQNHVLLCGEAADALCQGYLRLENSVGTAYNIEKNRIGGRSPPIVVARETTRWQCNLVDRSESNIDTPSPELLKISSQFSRAVRWMKVAEYISENARISSPSPARQSSFFLSGIFTAAFFAVWVNFPTAMRIFAYQNLSYIGLRLYGGSISRGVQRLPFGLYLKRGVGSMFGGKEAEFGALQLVRQYTSIPVPRPLVLICTQKSSFLITSRIEGECAGIYLDLYSDQEVAAMVDDLRQWVADLREIPKAVNPDFAICNAVGKACLDYRVGGNDDHIGPCVNEEGFNQALRIGKFVHRSDHKIFFTHGDLNPRNVLVKNGRITGIVDWENAGWYPEYWEYTKCHFAIRHGLPRWIGIIEAVFDKENYAEELRIERGLWDFGVF